MRFVPNIKEPRRNAMATEKNPTTTEQLSDNTKNLVRQAFQRIATSVPETVNDETPETVRGETPETIADEPRETVQDETVPELEAKAKKRYDDLLGQERKTAENYHALGVVLKELRKVQGLGNGDWQRYVTKTLKMDYNRAKRACRIADKNPNPEKLKKKTIEEALGYNPSPKVAAAKRAQAAAKAAKKGEKVEPTDTPTEQPTLTEDEKAAWAAYLTVCGSVERAKWVMETMTHA